MRPPPLGELLSAQEGSHYLFVLALVPAWSDSAPNHHQHQLVQGGGAYRRDFISRHIHTTRRNFLVSRHSGTFINNERGLSRAGVGGARARLQPSVPGRGPGPLSSVP